MPAILSFPGTLAFLVLSLNTTPGSWPPATESPPLPTSLQLFTQTSAQLPQASVPWKTFVPGFHIYNLCFFYLSHLSLDTGSHCVTGLASDSEAFTRSILSAVLE